MSLLSGIGSVLGGLGGIFGKKPLGPAGNILSQAKGAREAAAKYGFNPLTLLQYGQPGGAIGAGAGYAPLASIEMLTGGLEDISDVTSGDAKRRRQADELNLEIARINLDRARTGMVLGPPPSAADSAGFGPSPLGGRPGTVVRSNVGMPRAPLSDGPVQVLPADGPSRSAATGDLRPLVETDTGSILSDPRRSVDVKPTPNSGGVMIVDNPALPVPLRVPTLDGDEPLQWYDYPSLIIPGIGAGVDFLKSPAFGPPEGYARDGEPLGTPKPRKRKPVYSGRGSYGMPRPGFTPFLYN